MMKTIVMLRRLIGSGPAACLACGVLITGCSGGESVAAPPAASEPQASDQTHTKAVGKPQADDQAAYEANVAEEPKEEEDSSAAADTSAASPSDEPPQAAVASGSGEPAADAHPGMADPSKANATAPAKYTAKLTTTKGDILIDVEREWAPLAADRFYNLVQIGYFQDVAFFRVIDGFMAQAGIHGQPSVNKVWKDASIADEPVKKENMRGMVSFAMAGKNSRSNQFFINFADNRRLDPMGFAPFGKVRNLEILDEIYSGYGEGGPFGKGPDQARIQTEGNAYLKADFPKLDYIQSATIVESK